MKDLILETIKNEYKTLKSIKEEISKLEDTCKKQEEKVIKMLKENAGLEEGDKIKLGTTEEIVVINKFYITYSRGYKVAKDYPEFFEGKEEERNKLLELEFTLGAECFMTNKNGTINKNKKPFYNRFSLEDSILIEKGFLKKEELE